MAARHAGSKHLRWTLYVPARYSTLRICIFRHISTLAESHQRTPSTSDHLPANPMDNLTIRTKRGPSSSRESHSQSPTTSPAPPLGRQGTGPGDSSASSRDSSTTRQSRSVSTMPLSSSKSGPERGRPQNTAHNSLTGSRPASHSVTQESARLSSPTSPQSCGSQPTGPPSLVSGSSDSPTEGSLTGPARPPCFMDYCVEIPLPTDGGCCL